MATAQHDAEVAVGWSFNLATVLFSTCSLTILRCNMRYPQYEKNTDLSSGEGGHSSIFENRINCESTGMSCSPSKNMHVQPTEGAKNLIMDSSFTTR